MANLSTTTASGKTKYKFVFLGNQSVGKSSIIQKYIHNKFDQSSNAIIMQFFVHVQPTVGIDFLAKTTTHKSRNFRLQLWDTAGQERFKSLIPSYLKDAHCAIIVYDVSSKSSLADTEKWVSLYNQHRGDQGLTVLVGNKIDLPYREVTEKEGQAMAKNLGVQHFTLSAKTGDNVENLFLHVIDKLVQGVTSSKIALPKSNNTIPQPIKQQEGEVDITRAEMRPNQKQKERVPETPTPNNPSKNIVLTSSPATAQTRPAQTQKCC